MDQLAKLPHASLTAQKTGASLRGPPSSDRLARACSYHSSRRVSSNASAFRFSAPSTPLTVALAVSVRAGQIQGVKTDFSSWRAASRDRHREGRNFRLPLQTGTHMHTLLSYSHPLERTCNVSGRSWKGFSVSAWALSSCICITMEGKNESWRTVSHFCSRNCVKIAK